MSSSAFIRQYFLYAFSSKDWLRPVARFVTVWFGTSTRTFVAGSASPARDEDLAAVLRIVQDEVRIRRAVRLVTPVAEQVVAEEALVPRGRLQEAGGNDLVRVHVLERERDAGAFYDVEFLFHSSTRGSVM